MSQALLAAQRVGVLQANGYRTIFVGKAHFGPLGEPSEWPTNLGFDVNVAGCSWGQPGSYYGEDGYGNLKGNKRRAVPHLENYYGNHGFQSTGKEYLEDGIPHIEMLYSLNKAL